MSEKPTLKPGDMDRRNFLRGSSLFAMAAGLNLVKPLEGFAQGQSQQQERTSEQSRRAAESQRGQQAEQSQQAEQVQTQPSEQQAQGSSQQRTSASGEPEYTDAAGEVYRICPECGGNMYKSGRTWTCEICGYSYTE